MASIKDVYKRQQQHLPRRTVRPYYRKDERKNEIEAYRHDWQSVSYPHFHCIVSVSYTHLDVYKRQCQSWKTIKTNLDTWYSG